MTRTIGLLAIFTMCAASVVAAEPQVVMEDRFEGKLDDGWSWLREHKEFWRIKDGALEVRVEPGDAGSVKNALLRKAPDRSQGKFAIEVTITSLAPPTKQFEQAGITWYRDGKPLFKFVKERVDGKVVMVPGFKPLAADTVQMRLIVTNEGWTAQYRPDAKGEFQTAAAGKMPPAGNDQVSIQCYQGPDDEHWFRFDDFRILKLAE